MSEIRPTGPVPVMRPRNPLQPNIGSDKPPSDAVKSAPYNWGEFLLPHVVSFQGIVSTVSRIYRYYDEAMKHSLDNARFMRNDLMVMEPVEQRRRACALLNWHIEVDDEKDPVQKELSESLTKLLKAIPNFLKFRETLLDAVWYGKNAAQWRWGWKKVRGIESANGHYGNLCITDWKPLHGDKIVFRYDDGLREYDPNQVGIRVGAGYTAGDKGIQGRMSASGTRKIEACDYGLAYFLEPWERKLLAIHKHMIEDGEYEDPQSAGKIHGVGIRSRIYWSWYMKQELHAWMMEFLERNAAGIEIWYYPMGNPDAEAKTRKAAEERIGNARNVILMPRPVDETGTPFGVEMVPPNMGGADTVERILTEYFGDQIMRYVLGQTMTNKAQSAGLGSDLPQVQLGTYLQIIRYDAINLGETMTTDVVEPLRDLNYPQHRDIPVRFVVDTESEDLESKLAAWRQAYDVGLKTKASDWYRIIGASKPEDEDDVIENPVTKQQDRLYEQWQANKQGELAGGQPQPGGPAQVQGGLGEEPPPPELAPIDAGGGMEAEPPPEGYARGGQPDKYEQPKGGTYDTGNGQIPAAAITKGTIHELEHTKNHNVAREIALDHLRERPDYYEVLDRAMAEPPTIPVENSERQKLAKYSLADSIKTAADQTDTNPSDEQKQAGNYRKGKVRIHGMEIAIENPAGSIRRGKGWETTMANHYGYIKTQVSEADGDHVDVFIGPHPESEIVFVVDQTKAPTWTHFDEHKVMLGFTSVAKAKQAYLDNYSPGWRGFEAITAMTMPQFKTWLEKGMTGERASEHVLKYSKSGGPLPGGQGQGRQQRCACPAGKCECHHELYAKRRPPAAGQSGLFDEEKHPRGEKGTEKGGQFVAKGDSGGGSTGKPEPLPGQKDIFGGVEPAKPAKVAEKPAAAPPKQRQDAMFHGLGDLPGQQDLFNADKGAGEPEQPTKSKGHVGFYDYDGTTYEVYKDEKGDLYKAPLSTVIDRDTGNRMGRWEAPAHMADRMAKQLLGADHGKQSPAPAPAAKEAGAISLSDSDWNGWEGDRLEYAESAADSIIRGETKGVVLRDRGEFVGIATYAPMEGGLYVEFMATKREGFGRKLMARLCDVAARANMRLHLQSTEDSRGFYQAIGMRPSSDGEDFSFSPSASKRFVKDNTPANPSGTPNHGEDKESYSRLFDPGLMHQQLLERYYKQSPAADLDAWWAGGPGSIVVIQENRPMRYTRGKRGNVTVETVA